MSTALSADSERKPFVKGRPNTPTESHLASLADRAFLRMWSFPSVFRDQGRQGHGHGKEICDLLVVFGDDVIIFSDKQCAFPNSGDLSLDWRRWYRRAIHGSLDQLFGAERWIKQHPDRVFVDRDCRTRLPMQLPDPDMAKFHRIAVANGSVDRARAYWGNRLDGSLLINTAIRGDSHISTVESGAPRDDDQLHSVEPYFSIGRPSPERGFVHVLDEESLQILLKTFDTISDLTRYLRAREAFLNQDGADVLVYREADLIAVYFDPRFGGARHAFRMDSKAVLTVLDADFWGNWQRSQEYAAWRAASHRSYSWDAIIQRLSDDVLANELGDSLFEGNTSDYERVLRWLASPDRDMRGLLAHAYEEMFEDATPNLCKTRVLVSLKPGDPLYVFMLLPRQAHQSDKEYRDARIERLLLTCLVTRLESPLTLDFVGLAFEGAGHPDATLLDVTYFDGRVFNEELRELALRARTDLALEAPIKAGPLWSDRFARQSNAGPQSGVNSGSSKVQRNHPCPCGSGLKYKHCCSPRTHTRK